MNLKDALLSEASQARRSAYAPYSGFSVGAALRTVSGAIFSGANVENAAYPLGTCAEESAISGMVRAGEREIAEILILGGGDELSTPCGACRQRIREFAAAGAKIHVAGPEGVRATFTLGDLLPHAFGPGVAKLGEQN